MSNLAAIHGALVDAADVTVDPAELGVRQLLEQRDRYRDVLLAVAKEPCLRSGAIWCTCGTCKARAAFTGVGFGSSVDGGS